VTFSKLSPKTFSTVQPINIWSTLVGVKLDKSLNSPPPCQLIIQDKDVKLGKLNFGDLVMPVNIGFFNPVTLLPEIVISLQSPESPPANIWLASVILSGNSVMG
jgi:hypothetical protein